MRCTGLAKNLNHTAILTEHSRSFFAIGRQQSAKFRNHVGQRHFGGNKFTHHLTADNKIENIIPIRKSGKLPFNEGDLQDIAIEKEYGFDHLFYRLSDIAAGEAKGDEIHLSIIDDVLATGGTAVGIAESMMAQKIVKDGKEYKVVVDEFIFLVELDFLKGAERLEKIAPVKSLIHL